MNQNCLEMWTVYDHPKDYPDSFVARLWQIVDGEPLPTPMIMQADKLVKIQRQFEAIGLHRLPRFPGDDPTIVETWL